MKINTQKGSVVAGVCSVPRTSRSPHFVSGAALSVCSPRHCSEEKKGMEGQVVLREVGGPDPTQASVHVWTAGA